MVRNGLCEQIQGYLRIKGHIRVERTKGDAQTGRINREHREKRLIPGGADKLKILGAVPFTNKKV